MNEPKQVKGTCTVCGRDYHRSYCEYCEREKTYIPKYDFFNDRIQKVLKKFPIDVETDFKFLVENEGTGIFLRGEVGTGKSVYAAALLMRARKYQYVDDGRWNSFMFISIQELLRKLKESFNIPGAESTLIKSISEVDFLVLDDFGVSADTNWIFSVLYQIVDSRYGGLKTTIFTSNFNENELVEIYKDERIVSRIVAMTKPVDFKTQYRNR